MGLGGGNTNGLTFGLGQGGKRGKTVVKYHFKDVFPKYLNFLTLETT